MQGKLLLFTFLLSTHLGATSLSELIESGLNNNSLIKKTNLQIELMEAKKAVSNGGSM